jgi:hypothetical protein
MPAIPNDIVTEVIDGRPIRGTWDRLDHNGTSLRCFVPQALVGGFPGTTRDGRGVWAMRSDDLSCRLVFVPGGLAAPKPQSQADPLQDFFTNGAEACRILGGRSYSYLYTLVAKGLIRTRIVQNPTGGERMTFWYKDVQLCRDLTDGGTADIERYDFRQTYEQGQDPFRIPDHRPHDPDSGRPVGEIRDANGRLVARDGRKIEPAQLPDLEPQQPSGSSSGKPLKARRSLLDPLPD